MALYQEVSLSNKEITMICIPLVFNFVVNIFYACCLIFSLRNRQRVKQPLSFLLGFLLCCSLMLCVSLVVFSVNITGNAGLKQVVISYTVSKYLVDHSMTSYVWLIFYYYIQIVPSQCALLMWVKKNIKSVICIFLALDVIIFFSGKLNILILPISGNATGIKDDMFFTISSKISFTMSTMYILICLCISILSSFSTVRYLQRHMKSVAQNGSSFSAARLQSQMRVTITGIFQEVLQLLYGIFYFLESASKTGQRVHISVSTSFIVTLLYMSGTTVTLGVGQAVFRERVTSIWKALKSKW